MLPIHPCPTARSSRSAGPVGAPRPRLGPLPALLALPLVPAPLRAAEPAGPAAQDPPRVSVDAVNTAIDRGVDFLLRDQELDGSWRYHQDPYVAGQTALCLYTLVRCGLPGDHPAIRRALLFLERHPPVRTYSVGCLLMALEAHDPVRHRGWIERLAEQLVEWQGSGWAYPGGDEDLSCTQYAVLGLRAAEAAGFEAPTRTWEKAADYALRLQVDGGRGTSAAGFPYRAAGDPTGSMTAAGIAVLDIAATHLEARGALGGRTERELVRARDLGLAWLEAQFRVDRNPVPSDEKAAATTRWRPYYLYGVERVGALLELERLGAHDWYQEGARWLVDHQGAAGAWGTPYGEKQPGTCFGLLFLRRATAPSSGPHRRADTVYGGDDPAQPLSVRAAGDTPLRVWISSWGKETLERYEWVEDAGRGPRVVRVEYREGDRVLATVPGDPGAPAGEGRFPARLTFERLGVHRLVARAYLVHPGEGPEDPVAVEAPALEVNVRELLTERHLAYATDAERNLLREARVEVEASSERDGTWTAARAVDGLQGRGWLARPDDAEPWLRVELARPVRADRLLLSHARQVPTEPDRFDRAVRVAVSINKKRPTEYELSPDEQHKCVLDLGRVEAVRRVEVTVLEREGEGPGPRAVGFQELELQLAD